MDPTFKILVIDDDYEMRKVLSYFLKRKGYEVDLAESAVDALYKIKTTNYDLLLVDVVMPDINGLQLLRKLREIPSQADFIVITGSDSLEHREEAQYLKASGYFVKPFDPDDLLTAIEQIVRAKEKTAETLQKGNLIDSTSALVKLGQRALEPTDLDSIFADSARTICSVLGIEFCAIFQLLPEGGSLLLCSGTGWKEGIGSRQIHVTKSCQEGYTLISSDPITIEDYNVEDHFDRPALLRENEIRSGMTVIIHNSGTPFGVLGVYTAKPRKYDKSELHFLQGVSNIFSHAIERHELEDSLRMSEEKYGNLFEDSKDVFFITTPFGELIDINPAGVRLFGYRSKEEMVLLDIELDLFVDREERQKYHQIMAETGSVKDFDLTLKTKFGEILHMQETSNALRDERGKIVAYRGILRDVTRVKLLQQQLLESHKLEIVGRFAVSVAHDFNNLLSAIAAYCDMIDQKIEETFEAHEYVGQIEDAVEKGAALVRELLAFSRKQTLALENLDLNRVLKGLHPLLKRLVGSTIELTMDLTPDTWTINGSRSQLEQIIMNLVVNARDAMPKGGQLKIETKNVRIPPNYVESRIPVSAGDYIKMIVHDSGVGMDEFTQQHIFDLFFTTKEHGIGTGLGLSTVYNIVKQGKGYIFVHSAPQQGSVFNLYFPRALAESPQPQ